MIYSNDDGIKIFSVGSITFTGCIFVDNDIYKLVQNIFNDFII